MFGAVRIAGRAEQDRVVAVQRVEPVGRHHREAMRGVFITPLYQQRRGPNHNARAMRKRALAAALTALLTAGLASCAAYRDRQVEGIVLEALPRLLGPADRYQVTVQDADASRSRVQAIRAVGVRVQRSGTPVLDRIDVSLRDVALDLPAKQVTSIGDASVSLHLLASDLRDYLATQQWLERPSVSFSAPADITIRARLTIPGVPGLGAPAEFRGRLLARGSALVLGIEAMSFGDRGAPLLVRSLVEQAINPIFDAGQYAVPSRLDSAAVEADALVIRASGSRLTVFRPAPS